MNSKVRLAWVAAGLLAGTVLAAAAQADDVYLTNGQSFEGVIAERQGDRVRIRLEFGELKLAAASVARIESSRSALSDYLERRRALLGRDATATEWLDLARWARARELPHGYREALLEAAATDPHLEALAPGMRDIEYVFEADLDRWISYAEHMRRSGLVRHGGEWMRPGARPSEESRPVRSESREVEETLSRTVELLAMAQLERETRETRRETRPAPTPYGFPVAYFPGYFAAPVVAPVAEESAEAATPQAPTRTDDLFRRPPGSLLPVGGAHSGSRIRQPGSLIPLRSGN